MTDLFLIWRLAKRELRGGLAGFRIFIACLAVGVGAIAAVGTVNQTVVDGLRGDGRALLGGDVDLRLLHRSMSPVQLDYLTANAERVSQTVEMRAMARRADGQGRRALIELKAVDAVYPLVDAVQLAPDLPLDEALARRDGVWGAVAEANLLDRLGADVGDRLQVGDAMVEVRARIVREPDRVASVLNFGPRVMVTSGALAATRLIQPGSLIRYHARATLPPGVDVKSWIEDLNTAFPTAGWRVRDTSGAAPGIARFIDRLTLYLTFVGLTALLVGGIGVGNAVKSYLDSKTATVATLKCLGAPGRLIFRMYMLQILALSAIGIGIGLLLGVVVPLAALSMAGDALPFRVVPAVYGAPLALATAFGVLVSLTFALWPLARARDVAAGSLFRDVVAPVRGRRRALDVTVTVLGVAALAALTIATAADRWFAVWFVAGAATTLLVLWVGAQAVMWLARHIPGRRGAGLRLALANLHRPGTATPEVMLSLGTGLTVLVAAALIEGNLAAQIRDRLPQSAPAFFFVDIQDDQAAPFDETVEAVPGVIEARRVPSLRGRIVAIDGVPADQASIAPDSQWAVRGDRGLTYAATRPDNADIVAGRWWPAGYRGPPVVSMDAGVAGGLGVGVGDTVTLNVLGREIEASIASLRRIDWGTIPFDFVFIFAPGTLEAAPHTHIAAVRVPKEREDALEDAVAGQFPNVTAIRVRDALDAVNRILGGIGYAVRAAAAVTLLSGALVLAGAIAASRRRRVYDAVVLKVLGATRGRLAGIYFVEYSILGLVTGIVAAVAGTAASWGVVAGLMNSDWVFLPGVVAAIIVGCIVATLVVGFAGTWRALSEKSAVHLRNE